MDIANSTIVIAGGSSGIGLATAKTLAEKGARVIITGRDQQKLDKAVASVKGNITGECVDSADRHSLDRLMAGIGSIDHLVVSLSGRKGIGQFKELQLGVLLEGFSEKLLPQLHTAQAALPYLHPQGSITFISAVSAKGRMPGTAGLAAINGSIEIMVPVLAKELKPLRVNAVSPGVIDTAWWDFVPTAEKQQAFAHYASLTPVERIGRPEDVAQVIELVLRNTFLTGEVIAVDGGLSL